MPDIPEALVRFVQALVEDAPLRDWFESLALFSPRERATEFRAVAARMQAGSNHPELAHATALLAVPGMYESVLDTLAELTGQAD